MTQKISEPCPYIDTKPTIPIATRPSPSPRRKSFFPSCTAEANSKRNADNPPPPPSSGAAGLAC